MKENEKLREEIYLRVTAELINSYKEDAEKWRLVSSNLEVVEKCLIPNCIDTNQNPESELGIECACGGTGLITRQAKVEEVKELLDYILFWASSPARKFTPARLTLEGFKFPDGRILRMRKGEKG